MYQVARMLAEIRIATTPIWHIVENRSPTSRHAAWSVPRFNAAMKAGMPPIQIAAPN